LQYYNIGGSTKCKLYATWKYGCEPCYLNIPRSGKCGEHYDKWVNGNTAYEQHWYTCNRVEPWWYDAVYTPYEWYVGVLWGSQVRTSQDSCAVFRLRLSAGEKKVYVESFFAATGATAWVVHAMYDCKSTGTASFGLDDVTMGETTDASYVTNTFY